MSFIHSKGSIILMKYDRSLLTSVQGSDSRIPKNIYTDRKISVGNLAQINQKFMGGGMSQNWLAIPFFEYYYEANRFEYVVEFGSQKGCLSTYFANLAAITEAFFFETYELFPEVDWNRRETEGVGHWYERLAETSPYINYFHQDVFSKNTQKHIEENIQKFKTFIFCDGGNKVKEFNTYAPLLKSDDRIAVHDWGVEIRIEQIQETLDKYRLVPDEPFAATATDFNTWIMPFKKM